MTATTDKPSATGKHETAAPELVPALLHLRTLLVPTDFSAPSHKAIHYAMRLAEQFTSTVVLLHVIEPRYLYPYPIDGITRATSTPADPVLGRQPEAEKAVTELAESTARKTSVPVRSTVRVGAPWEVITTAAREEQADLIVIATHGYTGLKHVFMGSTAERVVRHASCPVLVVREHEHEFA